MSDVAALETRIKELEADLGRVALITRALMDACLKKGVLSQIEIAEMMRAADAADGVEDGKLAPRMFRARPSQ